MRSLALSVVVLAACATPTVAPPVPSVGGKPDAAPLATRAAPPVTADAAPAYPRVLIQSDCVGDVTDRILSEDAQAKLDRFHLVVRHMGRAKSEQQLDEVKHPVSWDVSAYTGVSVPAPATAWQRGYADLGPPAGTNAFQLHCNQAGSMINSWSFDHTEAIVGGGPNVVWEMALSTPVTPFGAETSALVIEADLQIPWLMSWKGGIGQLSLFIYLRERLSGRLFAYVLGVMDSRPLGEGNGQEFLGNDTFVSFVSSPLLPGLRYSTTAPGAPAFRNAAFAAPEHFRVAITAAQLSTAIDDLNLKGEGATLSRIPSDYELASAGVLHEIFVGTDPETNLSMGVGINQLVVTETR